MDARADALVLFGATGDLVCKKLIPAIYELACADGDLEVIIMASGSEVQLAVKARELVQTERYQAVMGDYLDGLEQAKEAGHDNSQIHSVTGDRWAALEAAGANKQRPLWASTGVKDPKYDDTRYVVELVARNTLNTAPEKTIDAARDRGVIRGNTIGGTYARASAVFSSLEALGIDLTNVFRHLETEGVEKIIQAWNELLESVSQELATAAKSPK